MPIIQSSIKYFLPESSNTATIYVYDMTGKPLISIQLNDKGESSISISRRELQSGMFLYALIVDGAIIDTKQMVITD